MTSAFSLAEEGERNREDVPAGTDGRTDGRESPGFSVLEARKGTSPQAQFSRKREVLQANDCPPAEHWGGGCLPTHPFKNTEVLHARASLQH